MAFQFSTQWLHEWVKPSLKDDDIAQQFTLLGLELDAFYPIADQCKQVVVGEVVSVDKHPSADRLQVCQVRVSSAQDNDKNALLTIVCGAKNIKMGGKYPTALVGAKLPGNRKIKRSKLRGVVSEGMLCSSQELSLDSVEAGAEDGIWELEPDAPVGQALQTYLQLDDYIMALDIPHNRGDCLSMLGISRELSAFYRVPLNGPNISAVLPERQGTFQVQVQSSEDCPHYLGQVIRGINLSAKTPCWMKMRLERSGLRSVSPVVDVTNYVMLALGQPMHAFDLACLESPVIVRHSRPGETIKLLTGQDIELEEGTQIIADAQKPLAIAGVMGGELSSVTEKTTDLFLESAFFTPLSVTRSVRCYDITTDSAYRFERGVDFTIQAQALDWATRLLVDIVGGQPEPVIQVTSRQYLPARVALTLRQSRVERVLGIQLSGEVIESILQSLGMQIQKKAVGIWQVMPPSFRFDINQEVDLIEELIRFHGYQQLPKHNKPVAVLGSTLPPENKLSESRICDFMQDKDYHEVVTYSFVKADWQAILMPQFPHLKLLNPISEAMNTMRTSLWPGLLGVLQYNQHRQKSRVRLFEMGQCFRFKMGNKGDINQVDSKLSLSDLSQKSYLGILASGEAYAEQWKLPSRPLDFFDFKGEIESLLALNGHVNAFRLVPISDCVALHPGESLAIQHGDEQVGYIGALHPALYEKFELSGPIYLFEMDLEVLCQGLKSRFTHLSKYPSIRRDIAIVVKKDIVYDALLSKIMSAGGQFLKEVKLFDRYDGQGIEEGYCSLGFALIFQAQSRTLIEDEVSVFTQKILNALIESFDVSVRLGCKNVKLT